jgi:hypothetical protein
MSPEIIDRVHKIEQILYGNEYTKEEGLVETVRCMQEDSIFYRRFFKWLAWIGGIVAAGGFTLLAIGIKYNIDLISKVSEITALFRQHIGQ